MRLLKEFNSIGGKRKLSTFTVNLREFILILGGTCLASRPDLVMSRANVISDKRRERTVDLFRLIVLVLRIVTSGGVRYNIGGRVANDC